MNTRILVVDDSATIRAYLNRLLTDNDMEVVEASDGFEALQHLGPEHGIHVVVSDLMMPGMNGLDLVATIRASERLSALPVIIVTSSQEDMDQVDNLVAGATDYICKPFDDVKLVAKVRNLAKIRQIQEAAERSSWTDALTGLANRRCGEMRLEEEMDRCRRHETSLAVAMLDIDHFKQVNDKLGHAAGDSVLVSVARELRSVSRSSDIVARWGGEEFLFAFPETSLEAAAAVLERFRAHLASSSVTVNPSGGAEIPVTISGGVTELQKDDTPFTLVERADKALYKAKENGRNRLLMWQLGQLRTVTSA